jgi:quercetin dioxygenase-like cupin family protein
MTMNNQNLTTKLRFLSDWVIGRAQALVVTSFLAASLLTIQPVLAEANKPGLIRIPLLENQVELPSKNINAKVIRVTFPPAFKTPSHTHDGPGPRYVVKGKLKVTEDGKVNTYGIGEVFWETGKLMTVENVGKDTAELIIFELAPAALN